MLQFTNFIVFALYFKVLFFYCIFKSLTRFFLYNYSLVWLVIILYLVRIKSWLIDWYSALLFDCCVGSVAGRRPTHSEAGMSFYVTPVYRHMTSYYAPRYTCSRRAELKAAWVISDHPATAWNGPATDGTDLVVVSGMLAELFISHLVSFAIGIVNNFDLNCFTTQAVPYAIAWIREIRGGARQCVRVFGCMIVIKVMNNFLYTRKYKFC